MVRAACLSECVLALALLLLAAPSPADPGNINAVIAVEDHSEILVRWARMGIRNATVINLDAHPDLGELRPGALPQLRRLYDRRDWESLRKADSLSATGLYHLGNFLRAAVRLGVAQEIYWIVPFHVGDNADAAAMVRSQLLLSGLPADSLSEFRQRAGQITGLVDGIRLTVTDLAQLPDIPFPLLTIDADFFPAYAAANGVGGAEAVRRVVRGIQQKRYRPRDISLSYSCRGGFLPITSRWLGDLAVEALLVAAESDLFAREPWLSLAQAESLLHRGELQELVDFIGAASAPPPRSPALLAYGADGWYLLGDLGRSQRLGEAACLSDRHYCAVLNLIGQGLAIEGRIDEAEQFLAAGSKWQPADWQDAFPLALALLQKGRLQEATVRLHEIDRQVTSFSIPFLLGETYLRTKKISQAQRQFKRALAVLSETSFPEYAFPELAQAVRAAARFYADRGQSATVARIRKDARLAPFFVLAE